MRTTYALFGYIHLEPTVPIFYEWEIPDSRQKIYIFKIQSLYVDLNGKLISNNFSGVKMDFRFHKKSE